jgi:hypothetical protein
MYWYTHFFITVYGIIFSTSYVVVIYYRWHIDMKSDDGACINEEEAIVILLNILRVSTYLHRDAFIIVRDPIIKQGVFGIPLTCLIPSHFQYLSHAGTSTLSSLSLCFCMVFESVHFVFTNINLNS